MSTYAKPHLPFSQQLDLLKSRELKVTDDTAALACLSKVGYYRLSAYWYPLRKISSKQDPVTQKIATYREDVFLPGSCFQHAMDLYVFDKRLRLLILDAIERIEVAIRVDVSHLLGARDCFAHTHPNQLHGHFTKKANVKSGKTRYQEWMEKYNQILMRSKEDFVRHYKEKYGLPLPIWVSVELWDFGMLSTFYQGMKVADKTAIAAKYGIPDFQLLESWLRSLNFVRNVAAHHSRLWNKNLIDQPKLPKRGEMTEFDPLIGDSEVCTRLYGVLCILIYLMRVVSPNSSWPKRLREMVDGFPEAPGLSIASMGFPVSWRESSFWR